MLSRLRIKNRDGISLAMTAPTAGASNPLCYSFRISATDEQAYEWS